MSNEKKEQIKKFKGDILALTLVLTITFSVWLFFYIGGNRREGCEAVILRDGIELGRYSLAEDDIITVRGENESYNLILISKGSVQVSDADCPDKLCIRQRSISRNGESIICLPHKLIIMIESPEESDMDAVTN